MDEDDSEMYGAEQGEEEQNEDSLMMVAPKMRKRKLVEPEQVQLTKHFSLEKEFPPLHTGGKMQVLQDKVFAMNDNRVSIFELQSGSLLTTLFEEEEEILTFAVSPNLKYIATSNKTYMVRVYSLDQVLSGQRQSLHQFRSVN